MKLPWKMEGTLQEHPSMEKPLGINTQKLLLEAQRDSSRGSSCTSSSRGRYDLHIVKIKVGNIIMSIQGPLNLYSNCLGTRVG